MDRRQGNWEKAIQELNESIARDPRNILSIHDTVVDALLNNKVAAVFEGNAPSRYCQYLRTLWMGRCHDEFGFGLRLDREFDWPLKLWFL